MSAKPLPLPAFAGELIKTRSCTVCGSLIPPARLKAVPNARACVPCLEANGDVPPIRRIDSSSPSGETDEVYFTENRYFEEHLSRSQQRVFVESVEETAD